MWRLWLTEQLGNAGDHARRERVADPGERRREREDEVRAVRRHPRAPPAIDGPERDLPDLVVGVRISVAVAREGGDRRERYVQADDVLDGEIAAARQPA